MAARTAGELAEVVKAALAHVRYSNEQPSLRKAWDAKDAHSALADLRALAERGEQIEAAAQANDAPEPEQQTGGAAEALTVEEALGLVRESVEGWDHNADHDEFPDDCERCQADAALALLRAELTAREEALREYGQHKRGCHRFDPPGLGMSPEFSGQECDCGLDAALSARPSADA